MHAHRQNLNEGGSVFWHGRSWLYGDKRTLQLEWGFGKHARFTHLSLNKNGMEGEYTLAFALLRLFAIWITLSGFGISDDIDEMHREIGISVHHGGIWLALWYDPTDSRNGGPHYSWFPLDTFLGKQDYRQEPIETVRATVSMPDGYGYPTMDYPCTVMRYRAIWKRPRWPKSQTVMRCKVEPDTPIPHPGKGTTSYNLDEDGLYAGTYVAETIEDAISAARESVMKCRKNYPL